MSSAKPSSAAAWLVAIRPRTLAAAIGPVAVGSACAASIGGFRLLPALAALVGALLIQVGTNFVNDAADFARGADDDNRLGPIRAAAAGLLSPTQLWRGAIVSFVAAAIIGVYLVVCGGWPIVVIGLVSIVAGIAYTAGPLPMAYLGVADIAVFVFFGFVAVCGTALVQATEVPTVAIWASVPVGALSTAMLAINNLRDRVGDRLVDKKTLAVRFGAGAAVAECLVLYAAAYATVVVASIFYGAPSLLLPLASLPLAISPIRAIVRGDEGEALSKALARTARVLIVFSLLLTTGIALW